MSFTVHEIKSLKLSLESLKERLTKFTKVSQEKKSEHRDTHPSCVMNDAEVGLVFQLPWFLELGVISLLLQNFVYECLVGGFREPALFI